MFADEDECRVRRAFAEHGLRSVLVERAAPAIFGRLPRRCQAQNSIVRRGFPRPPSYHIDRLRETPDRHLYDVITQGYGVMHSYAASVPPEDRWAIVAYIRALQLSQYARVKDAK